MPEDVLVTAFREVIKGMKDGDDALLRLSSAIIDEVKALRQQVQRLEFRVGMLEDLHRLAENNDVVITATVTGNEVD